MNLMMATNPSILDHLPPQAPPQVPHLHGRHNEITEVSTLLLQPDCQLVSLTGPAGIGKSALAAAIADPATHIVAAVSFDNPQLVSTQSPAALVEQALSNIQTSANPNSHKTPLLVLDSVDELNGNISFLRDLLSARPSLKVLVASRYPLELSQEWVVRVRGLDFRSIDNNDAWGLTCASQLFMNRVWTRLSEFDLVPHRRTINLICERLEGSPLAITLAADLVGDYSIPEIASRMTTELDFLSAHAASRPIRHTSLRAAMDSSWQQLSPEQQDGLARLSLFSGGICERAATEIARCSRKVLASLIESSWLRLEYTRTTIRYSIHPLLRQYGLEKLAQASIQIAPDAPDLKREHALFFMNLLRNQAEAISAVDDEAFYQIDLEYQNLRQAWGWLRAHKSVDELIQFVDTLHLYCIYRSHRQEAARVLEAALKLRNLAEAQRVRWRHLLRDTLGKADRIHSAERRCLPRIGLRGTASTNPRWLRSVAPPAGISKPRLIRL